MRWMSSGKVVSCDSRAFPIEGNVIDEMSSWMSPMIHWPRLLTRALHRPSGKSAARMEGAIRMLRME